MFCDETLDVIEEIAAGDLVPEGRVADHLKTCPDCAAAFADAQRVERMLSARPVPAAPAQFVTKTMTRLRRERWRSEQVVDAGFNVAIVVIVIGVFSAVWLLMNQSGLSGVSRDAIDLFGVGVVALAHRIAPQVPLYVGATALLGVALGLWWWAERAPM